MKRLKVCVLALGLFFLCVLVSCGGGAPTGAQSKGNPAFINVFVRGTKSLSGATSQRFNLPSRSVSEADFRRLETQFSSYNVVGLEFVNVTSINGEYSSPSDAPTSLTDLIFPSCLKTIGEMVFHGSKDLECIKFLGTGIDSVADTAFPDSFNSRCDFVVPSSARADYSQTGKLLPWIDSSKNGYLSVSTTITLNANKTSFTNLGSVSLTTSKYNVVTNSPVPSLCTPTCLGFTFNGYYKDVDCTVQVTDADGNAISSVTSYTDSSGNWIYEDACTLYAKWTENTYTIVFNKNSDNATGTSSTTVRFTEDVELTSMSDVFTYLGYLITGWKTSTATDAKMYNVNKSVNRLSSVNGDTVTLYAKWTTKTDLIYTIKYYLQNTSGTDYELNTSMTDKSHTGTLGEDVNFTAPDITGFDKNLGKTTCTNEGKIAADESTVLSLYYDRLTCHITWIMDGVSTTSKSDVLYEVVPVCPATPYKPDTAEWHYTFAGWNTTPTSATQDVTYTAQYSGTKQKYTVYIVCSPSDWGTVDVTSVANVEYGTSFSTSETQLVVSATDSIVYVSPKTTATDTDYSYRFKEWTTESWDNVVLGGTTTATAIFERDNNPYVEPEIISDCTLTLYYTYMNGSTLMYGDVTDCDSQVGISVKAGDTSITLGTEAKLEGYQLDGFYAEPACTRRVMEANGSFVNAKVDGYIDNGKWACSVGTDIELYAKWDKN